MEKLTSETITTVSKLTAMLRKAMYEHDLARMRRLSFAPTRTWDAPSKAHKEAIERHDECAGMVIKHKAAIIQALINNKTKTK